MNRKSISVLFVTLTLIVSPTVALAAPSAADDPVRSAADPVEPSSGAPTDATAVRSSTLDPTDPQFETVVPEPELVPGVEQELTIQVLNKADDPSNTTRPAQDVRATVRSEARQSDDEFGVSTGDDESPVEVISGTRLLGTVQEGRPATVSVRVKVPAGADPGTYDVPVDLEYRHRNESGDVVEKSTTVYAEIRIDERPRFEIVDTQASTPVGDTGTVEVTVENVGAATAQDATVSLQSTTSDIVFGESASTSQYVGEWEPGETRTLEFDATATPSAEQRNYPLQAVVSYEDADGVPGESRPLSFGITPLAEQEFAVSNVESTLHVGEEGTVTAEIVNTGERRVDNVVVVFDPNNPRVNPAETQYAVGSLGPGESVEVSFDATVSDSAEAGPRQFSLTVQYRNVEGDQRRSDPLDLQATIGENRPVFGVEGVGTTITAGQGGTIEMEITNNRDETLRDISAKLFADGPIGASDDEAFVQELAPGESETIVFGISADGSALEKTYPVKVDFQYDDEDGDSFVSDTYQVPVEVEKPEDDGSDLPFGLSLPLVLGGLAVLVVLGAGGYLYVRRE
jgi:hypothetical protein